MDVPGYAEALAWEQRTREEAFLGLCAPVGGVAVAPLTLRRLTFLLHAKSAFFHGRAPAVEDVCLFLWVVSPRFVPGDLDARALFLADLTVGGALADPGALLAGIEEYIAAAFNDAPASQVTLPGAEKEPMTCFVAGIVDPLAAEYGWTLPEIMDAPLSVIYQQLRKIAARKDAKATFINRRSRKVRGDWLRSRPAPAAPPDAPAQP